MNKLQRHMTQTYRRASGAKILVLLLLLPMLAKARFGTSPSVPRAKARTGCVLLKIGAFWGNKFPLPLELEHTTGRGLRDGVEGCGARIF